MKQTHWIELASRTILGLTLGNFVGGLFVARGFLGLRSFRLFGPSRALMVDGPPSVFRSLDARSRQEGQPR
eukprot:204032-Amphidinium_carterae.1